MNIRRLFCIIATLFLIWNVFSGMVFAEQSTDPMEHLEENELDLPVQLGNSSFGESVLALIKVILVLLFVIGLLILLVRLLARNRSFMSNRSMRNLSGIPLGPNKSLQIVEIGRSLYIIGVGENVQLIEKIDQPEEIEYIKQSIHMQHSGSMKWDSWKQLFKKSSVLPEDEEEQRSFQQVFYEKMQQASSRRKKIEELIHEDDHKEWSRDR